MRTPNTLVLSPSTANIVCGNRQGTFFFALCVRLSGAAGIRLRSAPSYHACDGALYAARSNKNLTSVPAASLTGRSQRLVSVVPGSGEIALSVKQSAQPSVEDEVSYEVSRARAQWSLVRCAGIALHAASEPNMLLRRRSFPAAESWPPKERI